VPQPPELDQLVQQLVDLFRAAEANLTAEARAILNDPTRFRRRARLRELQASVDDALAGLQNDARAWLEGNYPRVYQLGGEQGAGSIGQQFAWTQFHQDAVVHLAGDTFADVLAATESVSAETKAWVREAARAETAGALTQGRTAVQAGRNLRVAGVLADSPVTTIRYANGALHSMADYSDMLMRTKTAQAYNAGTLNFLGKAGVGYVEVLDGTGCGWTSHDSGDAANGTVRTVEEAAMHPLSHPRCKRSFAGRVDVKTAEQAASAGSLRTDAQIADQAATDQAQAQAVVDRAARKTRAARVPRTLRGG
jgi:hypothetical protein